MRVGDEMRKVDGGSGESSGLELELEELLRVRQRFLWTFSHELRTPLNVILCYNDLMTSGVLGPLNERQEQIGRASCRERVQERGGDSAARGKVSGPGWRQGCM